MTVRLDHIVLNVRDLHSAIEFYYRMLQFEVERLERFKAGAVPFPFVRINNETVIDLFPQRCGI
jgi:catechol 2,3-dioxygenase-like lactoylglutathione lyase family enzyme